MRCPIASVRFFLFLVLDLILLPSARASAASIPHGTVALVAENQWIAPGHQSDLGLYFQLEQGWHIYWVNPGDSGQPPRAVWHLPAGLTVGEIAWPAPRRLGTPTIVDFGYYGAVMLLVPVRASATLSLNQPVQLRAELQVLVCREICIPGKAQISLVLPIKSILPEPDTRTRELFAAARNSLPRPAPDDWRFSVSDTEESFVLTAKLGRKIPQATFFPLEESRIDNSAPQELVPLATGFRLTLLKSDQLLTPIRRLKGVLELSENQNYLIDAPVGNASDAR
jgi:DsbC/DsbD-like thiol-disulfide interchange protein